MLEHEMKSGPERVQQIKARTRSVLEKRLERYKKAVENRDLIDAQTETVQEVLQLLRDQSYSMRDPRSITEQIDGLVSSAEETERGVKDMEDILAMESDMLAPGSPRRGHRAGAPGQPVGGGGGASGPPRRCVLASPRPGALLPPLRARRSLTRSVSARLALPRAADGRRAHGHRRRGLDRLRPRG